MEAIRIEYNKDDVERLFLAVRNLGRHSGVRDAFRWIGFNMTECRKSG